MHKQDQDFVTGFREYNLFSEGIGRSRNLLYPLSIQHETCIIIVNRLISISESISHYVNFANSMAAKTTVSRMSYLTKSVSRKYFRADKQSLRFLLQTDIETPISSAVCFLVEIETNFRHTVRPIVFR